MARSETPDQRAWRLLGSGLRIAARIREEDPAEVAQTVNTMPGDEVRDALILLAACVPVDLPTSALLSWWQDPEHTIRRLAEMRPFVNDLIVERYGR